MKGKTKRPYYAMQSISESYLLKFRKISTFFTSNRAQIEFALRNIFTSFHLQTFESTTVA